MLIIEMNIFQRWKQTTISNKALVITGAIVALGTIGQLCITVANNKAAARQTDKLIEAANIQAGAAGKNAAAAESFAKSADGMNSRLASAERDFQRIAQDSEKNSAATQAGAARALAASVEASQMDERAWLGVSEFEVLQYDPDDSRKPFRMRLGLRNSGKTPALQIKVLGMFQVYNSKVDGPTSDDWNVFEGFFKKETARFVAAPGADRALIATDANTDIVTKNYAGIRDHTAFMYYFGEISYVDIESRSHSTRFCLWLAEPENKQLIHCHDGNDMN